MPSRPNFFPSRQRHGAHPWSQVGSLKHSSVISSQREKTFFVKPDEKNSNFGNSDIYIKIIFVTFSFLAFVVHVKIGRAHV